MRQMLGKFFDKTFWKFILTGAINTLFGTAVMFVFYNVFHLNYWISSASNYIFGSILSYFLNRFFTFENRDGSFRAILRFIVNITVCYLIAYGVSKPIVGMVLSAYGASVKDNLSMLAGMGIFVLLNYCGQRFFVFPTKRAE